MWLGAAIAPLTAALLYEAGVLLDPSAGKVFTNQELLDGFIFGLLPASYVLCLGLGAPVVLLLRRMNMLNCPIFVGSAGALSASMVVLVLSVSFIASGTPWQHFDVQAFFRLVMGAGAFMAFVAGVFCMIAGITWRSTGRAEAARR